MSASRTTIAISLSSEKEIKDFIASHDIHADNAIDFVVEHLQHAIDAKDDALFGTYEKVTGHLFAAGVITTGLLPKLSDALISPTCYLPLVKLIIALILQQKIPSLDKEAESQLAFEEAVFAMYELLVQLHDQDQATYQNTESVLFDWLQKTLKNGYRVTKDFLPDLFYSAMLLSITQPFRVRMVSAILETHALRYFHKHALKDAISCLDASSFEVLVQQGAVVTRAILDLAIKKLIGFNGSNGAESCEKIISLCVEKIEQDFSGVLIELINLAEKLFSTSVLNLIRQVVTSGKCHPSDEDQHTIIEAILRQISKDNTLPPDVLEQIVFLNTHIFTHGINRFYLLGRVAEFSYKKYKDVLAKLYELDIDLTLCDLSQKINLLFNAIQRPQNRQLIQKILDSEPDFLSKLTAIERAELFYASMKFDYDFIRGYFGTPQKKQEIEGFLFCFFLAGRIDATSLRDKDSIRFLVREGFILSTYLTVKFPLEDWVTKKLMESCVAVAHNLKTGILHYKQQVLSYLETYKENFFLTMNNEIFFQVLELAITSPEIAELMAGVITLKSITFSNLGPASDTWTALTENILRRIADSIPPPAASEPPCLPRVIKEYSQEDITERIKQGWKLVRLQGRTIILEQTETKKWLGIKIQKNEESVSELEKEYATAKYFRVFKKRLGLKSKLPNPLGIYQLPKLIAWIEAQAIPSVEKAVCFGMIAPDKLHMAYLYEVDSDHHDYFTYLHDPIFSQQKFALANRIAVNDLYHLFLRGFVYHQLADIFHDDEENIAYRRSDKGRYYTLANLLNLKKHGGGEIMMWLRAVEYVNVRLGLADLGDWMAASDFMTFSPYVQHYYALLYRAIMSTKEKTWILQVNMLVEYHLVLELCAGRRAVSLSKQHDSSFDWSTIAKQLLSNAAQAIAIITKAPEYVIQAFLEKWIDTSRYAEQLSAAMTGKWVQYLLNGFPDNFYGPQTKVTLDYNTIPFPDLLPSMLGNYSGQYPIKEGEKLRYVMAIAMAILLHRKQRIDAILSKKDQTPQREEIIGYKYFSLWRDKIYQRKKVAETCGENNYFPTLRA